MEVSILGGSIKMASLGSHRRTASAALSTNVYHDNLTETTLELSHNHFVVTREEATTWMVY